MESHGHVSPEEDVTAASRLKRQKFVCVTLGYPLLTIVTPLLTLLVLYVLFDCLDEEMCFKTEPHDAKSNQTMFNDQVPTPSKGLTDSEIRLTCLLSFLFLTFFVGIFLVFRLRNRKPDDSDLDETDFERVPILKADSDH